MRRVSVWILAVAACAASDAAQAGDGEFSYHHGWSAYVRDGFMFGYPGARYWGEGMFAEPPGPYCGGSHSWYPPHVTPWPYGPGSKGFGYNCAKYPFQWNDCDGGGSGSGFSSGGWESVPEESAIPSSSLLLNLRVPEEAVVYINGQRTGMTGSERQFKTENLEPGLQYTYEIRAEFPVDGKTVSKTETVLVSPGQSKTVNLRPNSSPRNTVPAVAAAPKARSTLALHVPTEARVYVNGQLMRSTGSMRTFSTSLPATGSKAAEYDVRVELESDGHVLVREETVSLVAGTDRDVTIDFNNAQVSQVKSTQR